MRRKIQAALAVLSLGLPLDRVVERIRLRVETPLGLSDGEWFQTDQVSWKENYSTSYRVEASLHVSESANGTVAITR